MFISDTRHVRNLTSATLVWWDLLDYAVCSELGVWSEDWNCGTAEVCEQVAPNEVKCACEPGATNCVTRTGEDGGAKTDSYTVCGDTGDWSEEIRCPGSEVCVQSTFTVAECVSE